MQLEDKDLEAIGKSRANRTMPRNVKTWLYAGLGIFIVGIIYGIIFSGGWNAFGVDLVGVVVVYYSTILQGRYRNTIISQLKKDYNAELDSKGEIKQ